MGMVYGKHPLPGGLRSLVLPMAAALALLGACGGEDRLSPSVESPTASAPTDSVPPADSSAAPVDSTLIPTDSLPPTPPPDSGAAGAIMAAVGTQPGIVFGSQGMGPEDLNSIHTGTWSGGSISPDNVIAFLTAVRSKGEGGRAVIKMSMGSDKYIKNADGTFSFTKWKGLVDRFRSVKLDQFIRDGTLLGHFLIDEPHRTVRWGGKIISHATLEAMAQYSKQIWPEMTTFVRVVPSWLASAPVTVTYRALDAGWLQYEAPKGDVVKLVAAEVSAAKAKGLGLIVGLNILDGGNGSSGVRGWITRKWAMSASEIRSYGTALLNQSYACGFFNWTYQYHGPEYYARSDIKSAMAEISKKARSHVRTSCRQ